MAELVVDHRAPAAASAPVDTDTHQDRLAADTADTVDIVGIGNCRDTDRDIQDNRIVQDNPDMLDYCAYSYASFRDDALHCCCCHSRHYRCHCPPGQIRQAAGCRAIKNICSSQQGAQIYSELTNGTDFMRLD